LLGAFAGLANAVPFLGPILGASAAGLAVLTDGQGIAAVARVVALFVAIKVVDDVLLQPLTIGRSLHLHPMLLLASVVAGNQALGIFGMVLAVPFVTALQEIARLLLEHHRAMAGPAPTSGEAAAAPHYVC
jgi:predicted PurR-regulated permease PerM